MNVLLMGNGAREHAIAWKINQSKFLNKLFVAPGNAGTDKIAINVNINLLDFEKISSFILNNSIDLLIVGPEIPLVEGIVDFLLQNKSHESLLIFGPDKKSAQLEGSKNFAKEFMLKYKIPTARYFTATEKNYSEALLFLKNLKPPYVLKADGLAAGKGVLILDDYHLAEKEIKNILSGKFGKAGSKVVIEEFIDGIECSVFVLCDGENFLLLPEAKDYKQISEGNKGLNTGGMGAISPIPFFTNELKEKILSKIIIPTMEGIKKEKFNYKGFIFFGLMISKGEVFLIEYNVRMGDPETEVIFPRIKSDVLELFVASAKQELVNKTIDISTETCTTVILASKGYPENYDVGKIISGIEDSDKMIFHAGTKNDGNNVISNGGRVLAVSASAINLKVALDRTYKLIDSIDFENKYYRKDIGFEFL